MINNWHNKRLLIPFDLRLGNYSDQINYSHFYLQNYEEWNYKLEEKSIHLLSLHCQFNLGSSLEFIFVYLYKSRLVIS
jgi:hypothetical protein